MENKQTHAAYLYSCMIILKWVMFNLRNPVALQSTLAYFRMTKQSITAFACLFLSIFSRVLSTKLHLKPAM